MSRRGWPRGICWGGRRVRTRLGASRDLSFIRGGWGARRQRDAMRLFQSGSLVGRGRDRFRKEVFPVDGRQVGDAAIGKRTKLLEEGFAEKFWINHGEKGAFDGSI